MALQFQRGFNPAATGASKNNAGKLRRRQAAAQPIRPGNDVPMPTEAPPKGYKYEAIQADPEFGGQITGWKLVPTPETQAAMYRAAAEARRAEEARRAAASAETCTEPGCLERLFRRFGLTKTRKGRSNRRRNMRKSRKARY